MTDESFAANLSRFTGGCVDKGEAMGINAFSHIAWVAGSLAGVMFDAAISDVKPLGLDFALPGMFIALLLPHFRIPRRVLALCFGAALALFFSLIGAGQWSVILATLLASAIAAFWPATLIGEKSPAKENGHA
jgi:predicted branched-subunit amino acid permease